MFNWLIEYYNAWVARGVEIAAMEGWHQLPDGTMTLTHVNGLTVMMYTPFGFWFFNLGLLVFVFCLICSMIALPKYFREKRKKNVRSPHE